MKVIQLTRGFVAIVDDEDFDKLAQWRWLANCDGYALRSVWQKGKNTSKSVFMHHEILPKIEGLQVDHINGDRRDNRRQNLRYATHEENARNTKTRCDSKLGIKGVSFHKGKFRARIYINKKRIHIGAFDTPEDAKAAYDAALITHHGQFARFN